MNIIACIDDGGGMMFNHRRQSQDRVLRERVAQRTQQARVRLYMSPYTARQFRNDLPANAVVDESFLDNAGEDDYCFVEDADPSAYADRTERLILYRWNRDYPRDTLLPFDLSQWCLVRTEDFEGSSHDKITEDIYVRCPSFDCPKPEREEQPLPMYSSRHDEDAAVLTEEADAGGGECVLLTETAAEQCIQDAAGRVKHATQTGRLRSVPEKLAITHEERSPESPDRTLPQLYEDDIQADDMAQSEDARRKPDNKEHL